MKKYPFLMACLLASAIALSANATNITGVDGVNGVYNIDPTRQSGDIGFRDYQNFELSKGDVANLKYDNINTFVNLVDKQVRIDGIVNTMKGNNFFDGRAVFVSPNGVVVGASGVLNVGSLGVYAPNQSQYDRLKANTNYTDVEVINDSKAQYFENFVKNNTYNNGGDIVINGKVISAGNVDLKGGYVRLDDGAGGIMLGVNPNAMKALTTEQAAEALFNQLVNTDGYKYGSSVATPTANYNPFKTVGGHASISIETPDHNNIDIYAPIKNFAQYNGFTGALNENTYYVDGHLPGMYDNASNYTEDASLPGMYDNANYHAGFTGFIDGHYYDNGDEFGSIVDTHYTGYDLDRNYYINGDKQPDVNGSSQGGTSKPFVGNNSGQGLVKPNTQIKSEQLTNSQVIGKIRKLDDMNVRTVNDDAVNYNKVINQPKADLTTKIDFGKSHVVRYDKETVTIPATDAVTVRIDLNGKTRADGKDKEAVIKPGTGAATPIIDFSGKTRTDGKDKEAVITPEDEAVTPNQDWNKTPNNGMDEEEVDIPEDEAVTPNQDWNKTPDNGMDEGVLH